MNPSAPTLESLSLDLPCIHCRYNLRTLPRASLCPECGHPVQHTLDSAALASWLRSIAVSILLLPLGSLIVFIGWSTSPSLEDQIHLAPIMLHPLSIASASAQSSAAPITESLPSAIILSGNILRLAGLYVLTRRPVVVKNVAPIHSILLRALVAILIAFHLLPLLPATLRPNLSPLLPAAALLLDAAFVWTTCTLLLAILRRNPSDAVASALAVSRAATLLAITLALLALAVFHYFPPDSLTSTITIALLLSFAIPFYLVALAISLITFPLLATRFLRLSFARRR